MCVCVCDYDNVLDDDSICWSDFFSYFFFYLFPRNLPIPILTREYLPAFASIADISDLKEQVRTLNLLILLLPDVHQKLLKVQ